MRTADQRRTDAAVLLALWGRSVESPQEDAGDKLWQMKLAFLAAHDLAKGRVQGLNLSFYRWTWGPLSNEVYDVWDDLVESQLVQPDERFAFTRRGLELAQAFYREVIGDERNVRVRESIDRVATEWHGPPETRNLMEHVYDLELVPCGDQPSLPRPIRAIARGTELVEPVPPSEATGWFTVEQGWLETLALTLKAGARAPLEAAIADFRTGRAVVG